MYLIPNVHTSFLKKQSTDLKRNFSPTLNKRPTNNASYIVEFYKSLVMFSTCGRRLKPRNLPFPRESDSPETRTWSRTWYRSRGKRSSTRVVPSRKEKHKRKWEKKGKRTSPRSFFFSSFRCSTEYKPKGFSLSLSLRSSFLPVASTSRSPLSLLGPFEALSWLWLFKFVRFASRSRERRLSGRPYCSIIWISNVRGRTGIDSWGLMGITRPISLC